MRYAQMGEPNGIGATMHRLDIAGKTIVVDCGLGIGLDANSVKRYDVPSGNFLVGERVDAIIVTHAHLDHIGSLPRLAAEHPEARIFASAKTFEAGRIVFEDTYNVSCTEIDLAKEEGKPEPELVFDGDDIDVFWERKNLVEVDLPSWIEPWRGWKLGFHSSGHDVGAMMVFIGAPGERPVFFTGDTCAHDQETIRGVLLPDDDFLALAEFDMAHAVMVAEATLGGKNGSYSRDIQKEKFFETLRAVEKRGGIVLCPAFAKNRAANIALMMIEAGFVPHVDGLARQMMIVEIGLERVNQLIADRKMIFMENGKPSHDHRASFIRKQDPCGVGFSPIIASSATLEHGVAARYAAGILRDAKNAVVFTGHMFPGTAATSILEMDKGRIIWLNDGPNCKRRAIVNCTVVRFDFSAHDRHEKIVGRIMRAAPETVIIHHCDAKAFEAVEASLSRFFKPARVCMGRHGERIEL